MNLTDSHLSQRGSEKLELAILSFFEQFRKIYVGDQAQKTSKVKMNAYLLDAHLLPFVLFLLSYFLPC